MGATFSSWRLSSFGLIKQPYEIEFNWNLTPISQCNCESDWDNFWEMGDLTPGPTQGLAHLAQVWAARPDAAHLVKPLPDAQQQTLAALVSRRRQLVQMRTMEGNHFGVAHPSAHKSIKAVIKSLETQIRTISKPGLQHTSSCTMLM